MINKLNDDDDRCLKTITKTIHTLHRVEQLKRQRNWLMTGLIVLSLGIVSYLHQPYPSQWLIGISSIIVSGGCVGWIRLRRNYMSTKKRLAHLGQQVEIIRETSARSSQQNSAIVQEQIKELLKQLPIFP